jgi:hypothetical protein
MPSYFQSLIAERQDGIESAVEDQPMPAKTRRTNSQSKPADDEKARSRRDEGWEDRLRLLGDARFVEVEWSGRDDPSWPLPRK